MFLPDMGPEQVSQVAAEFDRGPRYNVAPTQLIPCVAQREPRAGRGVFWARWGLLPAWADDLAIGNRMINARGETVDSKPSFKRAFASRRCLIPADGYFEWVKTEDGKQPYLIERPDHGLLAMAGLWEINQQLGSDDRAVVSCTIITTNANRVTSQIHNRMPVFLRQADHENWLDPDFSEPGKLKELLAPAADELLRPVAVSRRVNRPNNDDAACVQPVAAVPRAQSLFE